MIIVFYFKIVFIMLFLHILADYNLQGILASMKQKEWWINTYKVDINKTKYRYDYKAALLAHSFMWSFIICLPFLFYKLDLAFIIVVSINTIIHDIVDDLKANKKKINLIQDQRFHFYQIIISAVVLVRLLK